MSLPTHLPKDAMMKNTIGIPLLLACLATSPSAYAEAIQALEPPCPNDLPGVPCIVDTEKSDEVKRLIAEELHFGASSEEIESFFERHNITYSYDKFLGRYQAIIRDIESDPLVDQAVSIYVKVDADKRFVGSEIIDTFTTP